MNLEKYRQEMIKKEKIYKAFIGFAMAFLGLGRFLLNKNPIINDSLLGFLTGLILGINLICLYLVLKIQKSLKDEKLLKDMYIKEYDERENFIKLKSASSVKVYLLSEFL